jgi:hypothetical protein
MTEQQRRDQIMQARQQTVQQRSATPSMSDSDAERIVSQQQGLTQEQMIAIAMVGKMVQNDIGGIKKNAVGDSLRVSEVDMSKVMPSGIARSMGMTQQQRPQQQLQQPPQQPVQPPPSELIPAQTIVNTYTAVVPVLPSDPDQMEFDLNKKIRYEDIMNAIDKLENKVNILTDKINILIDATNKKKPKIANGT